MLSRHYRWRTAESANVVVLSDEKLAAQLDRRASTDGDKAILNRVAKVDGVVQTNIVAVVRPRKG